MICTFEFEGRRFCLTTQHSASSYGVPVLLVDGQLQDGYVVLDGRAEPDFDPRDDQAYVDEELGPEVVE